MKALKPHEHERSYKKFYFRFCDLEGQNPANSRFTVLFVQEINISVKYC